MTLSGQRFRNQFDFIRNYIIEMIRFLLRDLNLMNFYAGKNSVNCLHGIRLLEHRLPISSWARQPVCKNRVRDRFSGSESKQVTGHVTGQRFLGPNLDRKAEQVFQIETGF